MYVDQCQRHSQPSNDPVVGLRPRDPRHRRQRRSARCQMQKLPAGKFHVALPKRSCSRCPPKAVVQPQVSSASHAPRESCRPARHPRSCVKRGRHPLPSSNRDYRDTLRIALDRNSICSPRARLASRPEHAHMQLSEHVALGHEPSVLRDETRDWPPIGRGRHGVTITL